jgi:hypothetical protein
VLDGRIAGPAGTGSSLRFPARALSTGVHDVQVLATDIFGQQMLSATSKVKIDGSPPRVRLLRRGHALVVRVSDRGAGLLAKSVHVSFGDGATAAKRRASRHSYGRAGTFVVRVVARDRAGNRVAFRRRVRV